MRTGWAFLVFYFFFCFSCFSLVGSLLALGRWDQNFKSCLRNWNVRTPGSRNNVSSFSVQELRSLRKHPQARILGYWYFHFKGSVSSVDLQVYTPVSKGPPPRSSVPQLLRRSSPTGSQQVTTLVRWTICLATQWVMLNGTGSELQTKSDINSSLRVKSQDGENCFFFSNDLRAMIIESLNVLKPYPED